MSQPASKLELIGTLIVVVIATMTLVIYWSDRSRPMPAVTVQDLPTWRQAADHGHWLGPENPRVVLTELMDFQCPFCARLMYRVDSLIAEFPEEVAIVVQHYPLSNHPFALPAAIAAECAAHQGRFAGMYRALYERQDSLGVMTWRDYAAVAGVADLDAFDQCQALPADSFPGIANGKELGRRTGARGTPTVWVNETVLSVPTLDNLRAQVVAAKR